MSLNITSDGSPTPRKGVSRFAVAEDLKVNTSPDMLGLAGVKRPSPNPQDASVPLAGSSRGNHPLMLPQQHQAQKTAARMPNDAFKKPKLVSDSHDREPSIMDSLLQHLSEHSPPGDQHDDGGKAKSAREMNKLNGGIRLSKDCDNSSNGSVPITPATDDYTVTPTTDPDCHAVLVDASELQRLKNDLLEARNEVTRMNQELHTTHLTKSTLDHAIGSEADYNYYKGDVTEQTISQLQNRFNASTRPHYGRQESWPAQEDNLSEKSDTKSFVTGPTIWNTGRQLTNLHTPSANQQYTGPVNTWGDNGMRSFYGNGMAPVNFGAVQPQPRPTAGSSSYRGRIMLNEPTHFPLDQGYRGGFGSNPPARPASAFESRYNGMSPTEPVGLPQMGMYGIVTPYQPRPIGSMATRLSPEAAEFSVEASNPWNTAQVNRSGTGSLESTMANLNVHQPAGSDSSVQYITPSEPLNYRRLLDRNMSCNWKYIVDKIICNNDQQASIFLQQKLKVGTSDQKFEIVEAIISQAYPLMINRFGNFLVQRCFEHGTSEQVIAIAGAIRGNTLTLSMDAFGCHVIQKAFDVVPEEYKATMVHELLRRIPETVIHRYACHVWQKLFELRWDGSPPQIMRYVNEALRGMWHEVALGETGSLVVQNIFENCLEEDKRPCINEVLASIDVISHGQFGNWCIQHICEHGAPTDRSRAIEHIIHFATEYSMDQYASKVIEKCLKIGSNEFLDRYLERVCEGRPDRPRMPLIDIAGDQFGNYLIQYILTNSSSHHRELVASHVRKHMVSLRGSKYGSRVAMLCCNPALATRPGPPAGMQVNRYSTHNIHRGGSYAAYR